jgi:hypothetical protein
MTDQDVIDRCGSVSGVGRVRGPYQPVVEHYKPQYQWVVSTTADAYALLVAILPWLGLRRSAKARDCIEQWLQARLPEKASEEERFWAHVVERDNHKLWTGYITREGFGTWSLGDRNIIAHRYAWALKRGAVPARLKNQCGIKSCVEPEHWSGPTP